MSGSATSLKQLIQSLMPPQPDIIIGKVISESPLVIQGKYDDSLMIQEGTIILPGRFRENPLREGEEIHILVFNNRKRYYALDRR